MKKRSIVFFSLIMALIMLVSVGCAPKEPKEILEEGFINLSKIKSSQQRLEFDFSLEAENIDPMLQLYYEMLKDISIVVDSKSDSESMRSTGEFIVNLGGIEYTIEFFMTPEQMAFKFPTLNEYVVQEIEQEMLMEEDDKQEMLNLFQEMTTSMLANIQDANIVNNGDKEITISEDDLKATEIAVVMEDGDVKQFIEEIIDITIENPQIRKYYIEAVKSALVEEGQDITDAEIEVMLDEMKNEIDKVLEEINKALNIKTLDMKYFVDNKNNIRKVIFDSEIDVNDEISQQSLTIKINGKNDVWDINQELEIDIPEFNEDNTITLEEFVNQMLGGIMFY